MKLKKGGKIETLKCDKCERVFINGKGIDHLPNGAGFQLQDGRVITLCRGCISCLGMLNEEGKQKFFNELGVETKKSEG